MTRNSVFAAGEVTLHSLQESGHLEEISLLSSKIVPHFFSVINVGCDPLEDRSHQWDCQKYISHPVTFVLVSVTYLYPTIGDVILPFDLACH